MLYYLLLFHIQFMVGACALHVLMARQNQNLLCYINIFFTYLKYEMIQHIITLEIILKYILQKLSIKILHIVLFTVFI